jgi:hypothetical protein
MECPVTNSPGPDHSGKIRVLLANLSGVYAELLIDLLSREGDMHFVDNVQGQVEILLASREGVDVVILGAVQAYPPPGICTHLLNEYPHMKILVLEIQGSSAVGYWLGIRRSRLTNVTDATLISSIRSLFARTPTI